MLYVLYLQNKKINKLILDNGHNKTKIKKIEKTIEIQKRMIYILEKLDKKKKTRIDILETLLDEEKKEIYNLFIKPEKKIKRKEKSYDI